MVEVNFEHWDRLLFRDYLIEYSHIARDVENDRQATDVLIIPSAPKLTRKSGPIGKGRKNHLRRGIRAKRQNAAT